MIVRREDRARRADVIPQTIADQNLALDPRREIHAIEVAERCESIARTNAETI